jgi:hypothetical protein
MDAKQRQTKSTMMTSSKLNAEAQHEPLLLHQVELFDVPVDADDDQAAVAVFSSPARCSLWMLAYGSILFLLCLSSFLRILYLDLTYHEVGGGDALIAKTLDQSVWYGAGLLLIFLVGVLLFVPRQYQVLSNSTIVIQSTLASFKFGNIQDAHRNSGLCETVRLRWDFALDFSNRVFVERTAGSNKWQVSCSPQDPDGFVAAIRHGCSNGVHHTMDEPRIAVV